MSDNKCRSEGCEQKVDVFYYCDDHFEKALCDECGNPHEEDFARPYAPEKSINDLVRERDESNA